MIPKSLSIPINSEIILAAVLDQPEPPPGKTFRQLLRECPLGISVQSFRGHLERLERKGKIVSRKEPNRNRTLYFPSHE
jgi:DNA-binding transcriptional ArsR family regulator